MMRAGQNVSSIAMFALLTVVSTAGATGHWGRLSHLQSYSLSAKPSTVSRKEQQFLSSQHRIDLSHTTLNTGLRVDQFAPRGGHVTPFGAAEKTAATIVGCLTTSVSTCLPVAVALARAIVGFYRVMPTDLIVAQAGIVYCFAGGYYPTLFAALQAAQQCGWPQMIEAIQDLTDEALNAVAAMERTAKRASQSARERFTETTKVIFATVNPIRINQAVGALYTTWMGVSQVLSKEFARTIALSLGLGNYLQPMMRIVISPPVYMVVPKEYHLWVPVVIGWGSKAIAMSIAWRIQRVLTASTSAMMGGLMFSRAIVRMLSRRGIRLFGIVDGNKEVTAFEEFIGFVVGGIGLYSQLSSGFRLNLPFPLNLLTIPFELAERWIQWKITPDL